MTRPRPGRRHLLAMLTTLPAAMRAGRLSAAPPTVTAPFAETPRLFVPAIRSIVRCYLAALLLFIGGVLLSALPPG